MDTEKVFLTGDTAASIMRSIYKPGSRGAISDWAGKAGLAVSDDKGLRGTRAADVSLTQASGSTKAIRQLLAHCPLPQNLLVDSPEVLFAAPKDKARAIKLAPRLWTTTVPEDAFLAIDDDVCITSPAFTFVLRAKKLGLFGAMSYGNELCGRFSIDGSERGMNDHPSFTTNALIRSFLTQCDRSKGTRNARTAAKWLRDGFRSPKESDLYLLFELPRDYGGYAFDRGVEVNGRIEVHPALRHIAGVASYEVDLLWRRERTVVEYDGDPHDDPDQKLWDDRKTHVLQMMGFEVYRITWDILSDARELDCRARMLGKRLGQPVPFSTRDFAAKRSALREALLHGPR